MAKYPISLADAFTKYNAYTPKAPAVQKPWDEETGGGDTPESKQSAQTQQENMSRTEAAKNDADYRKSKESIRAQYTNSTDQSKRGRPLDISLMLPPNDAIRHGILK